MPTRLSSSALIFAAFFAAGSSASAAPAIPPGGSHVRAQFPATNAQNVCIDAPLRLTFDTPPVAGTGNIQILDAADHSVLQTIDVADPTHYKTLGGFKFFVYRPLLIHDNEADIYFPEPLAYGKTYEVKIDAGAFKNASGADLAAPGDQAGWKFSTKPAAPTPADVAGTKRITVSADGNADFCSFQGAVDSVPAGNTTPLTIFIKNGTYNEIVAFTGKNFLTFMGEDRKQTILQYADNDKFSTTPPKGQTAPSRQDMGGIYRRGVFLAQHVTDLTLTNFTIRNTTPKGGSQAECIILNGGRDAHQIVTNVDLISLQDTLQINGQGYVSNCYIQGDVDFMWGNGPLFLENVHAKTMNNKAYFTQIRNGQMNHGYVFKDCLLDGADGITGNFLARIAPAQFPYSEVVFINCEMTDAVSPVGWKLDGGQEAPNVHFWEYNSHTPDGKPVDTSSRLNVSKQLKTPEDAQTIKNYSDPVWVLGGNWNPKDAPIFAAKK